MSQVEFLPSLRVHLASNADVLLSRQKLKGRKVLKKKKIYEGDLYVDHVTQVIL